MVAKIGDFDGDDRRHQWGAETSTQPLAIMHAKPSPTRVVLGYVAIICTVVSWLIYMITMILSLFVNNPSLTLRFVVEGVLYADFQRARLLDHTARGAIPFHPA